MNTDLHHIIYYLNSHVGEWKSFARSAHVPYSTLEKVARGTTKNPRHDTYQKIRNEWLRRTGQVDGANSAKKQ